MVLMVFFDVLVFFGWLRLVVLSSSFHVFWSFPGFLRSFSRCSQFSCLGFSNFASVHVWTESVFDGLGAQVAWCLPMGLALTRWRFANRVCAGLFLSVLRALKTRFVMTFESLFREMRGLREGFQSHECAVCGRMCDGKKRVQPKCRDVFCGGLNFFWICFCVCFRFSPVCDVKSCRCLVWQDPKIQMTKMLDVNKVLWFGCTNGMTTEWTKHKHADMKL